LKTYKVIIDSELAESLWRLPARSRREIIAIFERLEDYPQTGVEDQIRAMDGRIVYRAKFNRWRICFWIDGPVDELRIVEVSRAK
jgi:mRNA-degrading endonuclease RelE of RelBE toxin-antitoxin system